MAELADARDLKSREIYFSYRFDPGFRHHHIAEWSSLVARRAHNPKVMRFKSHLRNQKNSNHHSVVWVLSFWFAGREFSPLHDHRRREWESKAKTTECCFNRIDVSRCESDEPSVAGEGRRHESRRGSVAARKCLKTTKCCFSLSVTEPRWEWKIPSPQNSSLNLHTFQHLALKCAKLKGLTTSTPRRLPHHVWKTAFFLFTATKLKFNADLLGSRPIY